MNQDDIIRMAREAGMPIDDACFRFQATQERVTCFAALVAAAAKAEEREACAKVCDDKAKETFSAQCLRWGEYFAAAIRARGQA